MDMSSLYKIDKTTKILIDTNILIFAFYPLNTNHDKVSMYTSILGKLKANNNQIFISSSVVSEFVNRWLRLDFEKNFQDDQKTKDFKKDYRVSENYKKTITLILKTIKKIYNNYNICNIDDSYVEFEEEQVYAQLLYKMSKNLSTYVRYGTYTNESTTAGKTKEANDDTRGRLQVEYTF